MMRDKVSTAAWLVAGIWVSVLFEPAGAIGAAEPKADLLAVETATPERFAAAPYIVAAQGDAPIESGEEAPAAEAAPKAGPAAAESVDQPLPEILRSESDLPDPVRETRQKLIEAAKSGDIEQLRTLMQAQAEPPSVAFGDPGDAIEYLKALAADADGREILAILLEVLQSGFVHVEAGGEGELYVWPYFAQYPIEALTPPQLVELFTLLTAADYEDMKSYGAYTFFRVGIAPDGRWLFFIAGD